jgi:ABC-2 type transport system ATP-binding protein
MYLEVDNAIAARQVLGTTPGVVSIEDAPPGLGIELDGVTRASVVSALVQAGIGVETVMQRHRLEDTFVELVGEETMRQ